MQIRLCASIPQSALQVCAARHRVPCITGGGCGVHRRRRHRQSRRHVSSAPAPARLNRSPKRLSAPTGLLTSLSRAVLDPASIHQHQTPTVVCSLDLIQSEHGQTLTAGPPDDVDRLAFPAFDQAGAQRNVQDLAACRLVAQRTGDAAAAGAVKSHDEGCTEPRPGSVRQNTRDSQRISVCRQTDLAHPRWEPHRFVLAGLQANHRRTIRSTIRRIIWRTIILRLPKTLNHTHSGNG